MFRANGKVQAEPEELEKRGARPLEVLVEEIKEDLAAAWRAGAAYYRGAGEKLLEAKAQLGHGKFTKWVEKNFDIGHRQATNYMALAKQN